MKAKTKGRTPFLLKPYSHFDGWFVLIVYGLSFPASLYLFIVSRDLAEVWVVILTGALLLIFFYMFRLKYKSLLVEEGEVVVINWLGQNKTYPINEIKGYFLQEVFGGRSAQLTTMIVIVTNSNEKILIDREYYYNEKLDRLLAAFERYQIPNLGFEEMKVKNKYLYAKISFYIYIIAGLLMATFIFLREQRLLNN